MLAALKRTSFSSEPFPHFVIEDVFSKSTYIGTLLSSPHITLMRPIASAEYLRSGRFHRYQMAITPKVFEPAHRRIRRAWLTMDKIMRDDEVCRLLCENLGIERPKSWRVHKRLQLDRVGARIRPHRDGENGALLTFQMYFPLNKANFDTGTELFKLKGKKFETVKQMPFKSNFAYAFMTDDFDRADYKPYGRVPPMDGQSPVLGKAEA